MTHRWPMALACAALWALSGAAAGQPTRPEPPPVPPHLQLARDFVAHTRPENNRYALRHTYTRVPGDLLAQDYVVHTDCSGFVEEVFRRTDGRVPERLGARPGKTRHSTADWHRGVVEEQAFERVRQVTALRPGDVAVWLYLERERHNANGHMLFIDSLPVPIAPRAPVVAGLTQYEVAIIDTSQEAKSRDDTRYVSDAGLRDENEARGKENGTLASPNRKGVGRGRIRFYADAQGEIQGVAFGFGRAKFHPQGVDWDIAVGRPRLR